MMYMDGYMRGLALLWRAGKREGISTTMWAPGTNLRSPGLSSKCLILLTHLAGPVDAFKRPKDL